MTRKRVLITGATSGIGKATACGLASRGFQLVLVGRDESKCLDTMAQIHSRDTGVRADYLLADLSVQDDVRRLAQEYRERYDTLDVLINNAGALFLNRLESADGIEMTFALNHLAYFLLTNKLLDVLSDSAPSRIINVASGAHRGEQLNLSNLQMRDDYSGRTAYGRSKLANILFTYELSRRLEGGGVSVNAVHPGFVGSRFGKNNGGFARLIMSALHLFARSPEKGAETVIYLASSPELEPVTGMYFFDRKARATSASSYDKHTARELWEVSKKMTGLKDTI